MRKLLKRLEAVFAAVAFAEEGEADTARRIVAEADRQDSAADAAPEAGAARGSARPRRQGKVARLS